jgi:hypothetical protein
LFGDTKSIAVIRCAEPIGLMTDFDRYGAGAVPYGDGASCSPRTFRRSGDQSSTAFDDLEHCIVAVTAFGEAMH